MSHICEINNSITIPSEIKRLSCSYDMILSQNDHCTELDYYVNMIVIGKHSFIFDKVQNRTFQVTPYDPSIGITKQVPIVDASIAYE